MRRAKETCPVGKVAKLLGDHYSLLIVRDLLDNPRRFGELEVSLGGSTRTLAKKLQQLEREKIVTRKESAESPACVKYQLTKKGAAFEEVVAAMRAYGTRYLR